MSSLSRFPTRTVSLKCIIYASKRRSREREEGDSISFDPVLELQKVKKTETSG